MRREISIVVLAGFLMAGAPLASAADQKTYATPNAAMAALIASIRARNTDQTMTILGPELKDFIESRDTWENDVDRDLFLGASGVVKFEKEKDPNRVIAYLGKDEWPFPAPLVKTPAGWKFDGKAALEEIQDRFIGRNELGAIAGCLAYVDAQLEYFSIDRSGDGYLQFAQKINSTPGKFDGLYWSSANGEDVSPIGPYGAQAAGVETNPAGLAPHSGYYAKVLTAQGSAAVGGARSYVVNGRMLTGFALVAWPAEYKVSGISTFIVNQEGVVYQKDLGPDSAQTARAMTEFNADSTWTKVE